MKAGQLSILVILKCAKIAIRTTFLTINWFFQATESGYFEILKYFVETKCVQVDSIASNGYTPLHLASRAGNKAIIEYLLQNGACLYRLNSNGWGFIRFEVFECSVI